MRHDTLHIEYMLLISACVMQWHEALLLFLLIYIIDFNDLTFNSILNQLSIRHLRLPIFFADLYYLTANSI